MDHTTPPVLLLLHATFASLPLAALPSGPRLCLGQRLAELEGVFVLTGLLGRFSFRQVVPGSPVTYNLSATMPMKEGLMVLPARRT